MDADRRICLCVKEGRDRAIEGEKSEEEKKRDERRDRLKMKELS